MKIDIEELKKRSEYIDCHEKDGLLLWNYNHKCQFDAAWDNFTEISRGLVTDLEGNIIARPFRKFFNYGERDIKLPDEAPIITEKMDGSLFIVTRYGDKLISCTRGSFDSDQAVWARNWMEKNAITLEYFKEGLTYLFEVVYKENRVVVDYKDVEGLFLITVIDNETGKDVEWSLEEYPYNNIVYCESPCIEYCVNKKPFDIDTAVKYLETVKGSGEEGFVAYYPTSGLRIKIKASDYVRLHKLLSNLSTKSIWENLMNCGDINSVIKDVPDEYYKWIRETETNLNIEYAKLYSEAVLLQVGCVKILGNRKFIAMFLQKSYPHMLPMVMNLLDGKSIDKLIWMRLKPKYSKPLITE